MAFPGVPTREGGGIAQPDLASSVPEVSDDGLTWTFRLRPGIRYGPPLQDVEVAAADIIRGLERASLGPSGEFFFGVIRGYAEYVAGEAESITGLEAPDDLTLRIHLTAPSGDLADRMSVPQSAPIPPHPTDPEARFGAAAGHDEGYGGFLVSTGPYMLAGSEALDFSRPADAQSPAAGWQPGTSISLVRNPSWVRANDPLREAYVDGIELTFEHETLDETARALDENEIDLVWYADRPPQAPAAQVDAYRADPARGFVSIEPADTIQAIWMNVAVPPFDDIHVRRAVNLVVDKAAIQTVLGGPDNFEVVGHIGLNSQMDDLLLDYDPYGAPGNAGDVDAARAEMALSRYDSDADGRCDHPVCTGLAAYIQDHPQASAPGPLIADDLENIGILLDVQTVPTYDIFGLIFDLGSHTPVTLSVAWQKAFPNASDWFLQFTAGGPTAVGMTPDELAELGYAVTEVPSVDERIAACLTEFDDAQRRCWADLDQHLMENVIPWVPYLSMNMINVVPARITHYSFSQSTTLPALDRIALAHP
jgi:ABC-type transport system substrate-binding protein